LKDKDVDKAEPDDLDRFIQSHKVIVRKKPGGELVKTEQINKVCGTKQKKETDAITNILTV
jgi:hypothetical protein